MAEELIKPPKYMHMYIIVIFVALSRWLHTWHWGHVDTPMNSRVKSWSLHVAACMTPWSTNMLAFMSNVSIGGEIETCSISAVSHWYDACCTVWQWLYSSVCVCVCEFVVKVVSDCWVWQILPRCWQPKHWALQPDHPAIRNHCRGKGTGD